MSERLDNFQQKFNKLFARDELHRRLAGFDIDKNREITYFSSKFNVKKVVTALYRENVDFDRKLLMKIVKDIDCDVMEDIPEILDYEDFEEIMRNFCHKRLFKSPNSKEEVDINARSTNAYWDITTRFTSENARKIIEVFTDYFIIKNCIKPTENALSNKLSVVLNHIKHQNIFTDEEIKVIVEGISGKIEKKSDLWKLCKKYMKAIQ